jgi:hypothetical protein
MGWIFASCLAIGAICALRAPILVFALLVVGALAVVFALELTNGSSAWDAITLAAVVGVGLEAGYVLGYVLLHLYFSRHRKRPGESSTDSSGDQDARD